MDNQLAVDLYYKIINRLLDPGWFEGVSLSKKFINKYIDDDEASLMNGLTNMVLAKDFSCTATLQLCEKMINDLAGDQVPGDWLFYIYQYVLSKSFPHAVEISLNKFLESPCELYLEILKIVSHFQKSVEDDTWQSKYPLTFLTPDEERNLESHEEYKLFLDAFHEDNIYELMRLHKEVTHHNTIDHICGVHYLSLFIARQLKAKGLPIDLGRISGSTAGHDIGKYGCNKNELKRVPYLHYYYTDQWFKEHEIVYIGHIALNHSVWDLELENLSLESLILIYSDFRVKNYKDINDTFQMHIFDLSASFDVILKMLDDVDAAKKKRYGRVYAKLKDFENFMIHLGINTDVHTSPEPSMLGNHELKFHYSLMQGKDIIENIKYLSIHHSTNLMHRLRDEYSLNKILELARSEKNWKNLREYLRIFEEYSTYLTQKQKLITLKFLYENLIHTEDDIRRHCAELIGSLIALFDEDYRKEVPENVILAPPEITSVDLFNQYLKLFIFPDYRIIPVHQAWIGYSLNIMVSSFFNHFKNNKMNKNPYPANDYIQTLLSYYENKNFNNEHTSIYLLETIRHIPVLKDTSSSMVLYNFTLDMLRDEDNLRRLVALKTTYTLITEMPRDEYFIQKLTKILGDEVFPSPYPSENYLKLNISQELNLGSTIENKYAYFFEMDMEKISDIFLSNLKIATNWMIKRVQIEILLKHALNDPKANGLHTSIHFCNLLKVSSIESVRTQAGEAILKIIPHLPFDQRNEVVIELQRALELNDSQFSEYIPYFLGQLLLSLRPIELDECIEDLIKKIKHSNDILSSLLLKTIGIAISHYPKYKTEFAEDEKIYNDRLMKMLGILLNGVVNYSLQIKQIAFGIIGKEIFGSKHLTLEDKNHIFQLIAKKILTLLTDKKEEALLFLGNSAGLNHIYRFIADYTFFIGEIDLKSSAKIAFFPGTFDPFSLSHKEIVKSIRNLGYEVYLAIDEFSWSKQTLPHLLRKNIINMSIADELNIYIYPEEFPTNIANTMDLKVLKDNFNHSEVHIVIGTDVVLNASSYQGSKSKNSIHSFPHIIIKRNNASPYKEEGDLFSALSNIDGEVTVLTLPPQFEEISSTQIRNYIDESRDISKIVDPLAQKYIYENGFYKREPQNKTLMESISIHIDIVKNISVELINELASLFNPNYQQAHRTLIDFSKKPQARLLVLRDINQRGKILGFSAHHLVRLNMLYHDLENSLASDYIRKNSRGKILILDGIFIDPASNYNNLEQIILTETLSYCLSVDYEYTVYRSMMPTYISNSLHEILRLQGFMPLPFGDGTDPVFVVNMSSPSTLNLDVHTIMKESFRNNVHVQQAIASTRKKLQQSITNLFPGHLVLSFDRNILYETLVRKICAENDVPPTSLSPRVLGPCMCVPFGMMLNRYIVPNTVTKALHIEKLFSSHMKDYKMGPFPNYLDLDIQVKMLHSFNRPIILVDDILHKGYRINTLNPLLNKANVEVKKIMVGILSARGKELMDKQQREVDCAYYIPRLRGWFNENALYPFMGGDTLWRDVNVQRNLVPSVNLILPYTSPTFIKEASQNAIYNFSKVCIENTIELLTVIENEYHQTHERALTLGSLGEVFISPRCPDHGNNMYYDLNLSPSHYLENDMDLLSRLEHSLLHT